jgi:hypothetical protein
MLFYSSARAVGRGGVAASNIKRYEIATVYHKSVAGGHPRESLEATFDVIQDETNVSGYQLEAEAILVLCQAMSSLPHQEGRLIWHENMELRTGQVEAQFTNVISTLL